MKRPGSRIVLLMVVLLVFFALVGEIASAAKLQEIRTGKKSGFTRLVFQFEAAPRFQVIDKAAADELSLLFIETTPGFLQAKQGYSAPVETIAIQQDGPHLKVVVSLSTPGHRLKTFTLTEPHRVVFDLYPTAVEEPLVLLNKLVIRESVEPEPPTKKPAPPAGESEPAAIRPSQIPATVNKPAALEPDTKAPEPALPAKAAPATPEGAVTAPAQPPDPSTGKTSPENKPLTALFGKFQQNLILVLAGISIVILALVGFLLLQKRNNAEKNQPIEARQELKTTADIMASIDARIQKKFKQYEEANPE